MATKYHYQLKNAFNLLLAGGDGCIGSASTAGFRRVRLSFYYYMYGT